MKRGDIYLAAARGAYTGEARPVVIVQDDRFDASASITVCPLTATAVNAPLLRLAVDPGSANGLSLVSHLMVDKLTTMPRANLTERLGRLQDEDMLRLGRAMIVFLGVAGSTA